MNQTFSLVGAILARVDSELLGDAYSSRHETIELSEKGPDWEIFGT